MAHHIDIQHTAKLARLKLTEQEAVKYEAQLAKVLDYMETLEGHDLSGVELTAHAMPIYDVWREDVSVEGLDRAEALANAPRKTAGQFLISRVVE
ncbi:Asp-tRNA(Asn)/Glu-tRNA(Gln) amidotransferase subunit GatC [Verrucomicrobium sp. BvORR034]|jgi:aspartyl-tRNA(Asn)/glutamyl-tRNA(Gln) amidotransferase subunit C|uniref:Asp-tRNA(Asn)/Glu-tRNA(Gln) amidotransferase subunit GatC n=1 Tax=Verrucomicrobium sp. BvORR034 TaxID=1396418 RepID=UPI0006791A90|nr:Asp-tRNA(Asn)/Glu-tRNA(Gln) amidotransferase subunit GatC [Verrucomicrobium sp. BvORR034]